MYQLTSGGYQLRISPSGSGQSSCNGLALNRWRDDPVEDDLGYFLYLRDLDSGDSWSQTHQPVKQPLDSPLPPGEELGVREFHATPDRLRFRQEHQEILSELDISLAPLNRLDAGLELRRLRLRNQSDRSRRIEITSYLEVVLYHHQADAAHPAFAKLFVQTDLDLEHQALLAWRRPRGNDEHWPWMIHALVGGEQLQWETDRKRFLGRGGTPARPAALLQSEPLSGTVGNVLDPVFSLRTQVELAPGEASELLFLLGMAPDREAALGLVKPYLTGPELVGCGEARTASFEVSAASTDDVVDALRLSTLQFFNGYGGFSADGREYHIPLPWQDGRLRRPPMPWINVIANERFGLLVSESGAGCTWSRNSQAHRLTPWYNDPVSDPHAEALYIRDESSGHFWSPLPGPAPDPNASYESRHGFGYSSFLCSSPGLEQEVTLFVPAEDPLRILRLRLTNKGPATRHLTLVSFQRLVLGFLPQYPNPIQTQFDSARDILLARNPHAGEFADGIAFAFAQVEGGSVQASRFSSDRLGFIGRHGDLANPAALQPGVQLDGGCGSAVDPCFAQSLEVRLAPGQTLSCAFLLGECLDETELDRLISHYRTPGAVEAALQAAQDKWRAILQTIQVQTPDPGIDLMVNGWLTYQNLSCRIWGRTAYYQSSGAYGYRDQLQDAGGLALLRPDLTRAQILLHARHQFEEGDVLHWWHPEPLERGLRTRFSDDLLWLAYITAHYLKTSGDQAILDEAVPLLSAPLLAPGQDEAYLQPDIVAPVSLYEHCCRTLDRSLTRGAHNLPLMGTGDWNDGMNRVGRLGRGESVWLGFFLYSILGDFIPICRQRGDLARHDRYAAYRRELLTALNTEGWDGDWYRRAYYDDGTPLGSKDNDECRIDALAQAWAVISLAAPPDRAQQAMDQVETQLISDQDGIIRLLTPAFVNTPHDAGYIKGYVAGVRENGGQYSHAACWVVRAVAELGRHNRAAQLLANLGPIAHSLTPEAVERYQVEPYVIAADIYGEPPHIGRGGWTWYTGSAGWMYRVAVESVLGFRIEHGNRLVLRPCIPDHWPGYRLTYRYGSKGTLYEIRVENPSGKAERIRMAELDGEPLAVAEREVSLVMIEDGERHVLRIELG